ncbi:MAG: hypothetical protein Q8N99_03355 [Nanoarchaeota archaeon]|nr:hypothetical protein [Nanoarchaeota archaeon]
MEQYWMPKKLDFKNLRKCLDNYKAESIYIRLVGSSGGTVKVDEGLESKTLDFKKNKSGLHMLIDDLEVFHFPLKDYGKGFSLGYERIDEKHRMVMLSTGIDPDDPDLPEPTRSILRTVLDYHLMEIYFEGKISLKFHSWWIEPHWKYWTIAD